MPVDALLVDHLAEESPLHVANLGLQCQILLLELSHLFLQLCSFAGICLVHPIHHFLNHSEPLSDADHLDLGLWLWLWLWGLLVLRLRDSLACGTRKCNLILSFLVFDLPVWEGMRIALQAAPMLCAKRSLPLFPPLHPSGQLRQLQQRALRHAWLSSASGAGSGGSPGI